MSRGRLKVVGFIWPSRKEIRKWRVMVCVNEF